MFTLGFRFKPWASARSIADGPSIWNYINEAAAENGIDKHIRVNHRVLAADWSDADNRWTLTVEAGGQQKQITCSFLSVCSGYYNYDAGYSPEFPGSADFKGQIVHPQHWPEDLAYASRKIVVIGTGPGGEGAAMQAAKLGQPLAKATKSSKLAQPLNHLLALTLEPSATDEPGAQSDAAPGANASLLGELGNFKSLVPKKGKDRPRKAA